MIRILILSYNFLKKGKKVIADAKIVAVLIQGLTNPSKIFKRKK
jgi:hypothetical protein